MTPLTTQFKFFCPFFSQEELDSCGLDEEQVRNLKRTFDQFDSNKVGALSIGTVQTILKMMGMHVSTSALEVFLQKMNEIRWCIMFKS